MDNINKPVIGRFETLKVLNPQSFIVPAKTDTGAYNSAMHASNVYVDDAGTLHFTLMSGHPSCPEIENEELTTTDFDEVTVSNSFGDNEARYRIKLTVEFGGVKFKTKFTLTDRSKKVFPVLMGRTALNKRFLVDTAKVGLDKSDVKAQYLANVDGDEDGEEAE